MDAITLYGSPIGSCVIGDFLILFTTDIDGSVDRIYKIFKPTDSLSDTVLLFQGNLNFSLSNKIQTLPFYENNNIQKVYWIDGLNQPRVINVAVDGVELYNYTSTSFDFIQTLELNEEVSVTKQYGGGSFKSGVIQYAFTYFNKNGAESNIFHITPLNYISPIDRGGKVDEIVNNTFKISLTNLESKFEYLRIYSIHRTSIDTTPEVRNLIDLKVSASGNLSFIDNGVYGSIVSSDLLLYVGGEEVIPGCMSQKNNTLFLGNIQTVGNQTTPSSLDAVIADSNLNFSWIQDSTTVLESISESNDPSYPYRPKSLAINDKIKHFKFDETYRLGIQGQYATGKWSSPIWLCIDKTVDLRYQTIYDNNNLVSVNKVKGIYNISEELYNEIKIALKIDFVKIRPVMVPLKTSDRTIIAQGMINNTLAIMKNRLPQNISSSKFSYPDYLFRTENLSSNPSDYDGRYNHFDILKISNKLYPVDSNTPNYFIENMAIWDTWEFHDIHDFGTDPNGAPGTGAELNGSFDREFMFVDKNTVNFWSPEITHNYESISPYMNSVNKVGLYGFALPTSLNSEFKIDSGTEISEKYISRKFPNYDNTTIVGGWDYRKRNWFSVTHSDGSTGAFCVPIWSAKHLSLSNPNSGDLLFDLDFTESRKSGSFYFGFNNNISNKNFRYELDINSPSLLIDSSDIFYNTNLWDNAGKILYSKSVNKQYTSNSFPLVYKGTGDPLSFSSMKNTFGMEIKYNTASHGIFSFKQNGDYVPTTPLIMVNPPSVPKLLFNHPYYNEKSYATDILNMSNFYLRQELLNCTPIFDLYTGVTNNPTSNDYSKYGGNSDDALYNNNWIPCGKPVRFEPNALLEYTDGDTFIQRFDLLRVFPDDLIQIPQHTEIISFICESFINLDGRCDVNRYNTDSSLMAPTNYGLLNSVYSQKNNYFNYNILDPLLFNTTNFTNTIIWSKTKIAGSINDAWTNLNMLSSIDLDGVYGEVSSINLFNNDLYAFQKKGVAKLLFNERIQQQASDGISVELVNGYKVPEYRYITNQYGCEDKWSITEGKQGVYFVDYTDKSLISIGDGIKDLGLTLGFKSWFNNIKASDKYILSYDRINSDLYIHNDDTCLNYSELLQSFVSFYDYVDILQMKNVWNEFVSIKDTSNIQQEILQLYDEALALSENENNLFLSEQSTNSATSVWINNAGEYNKFYGVNKPFSIEYLFNPDPQYDKVFNTFEYRLDNQSIDWTDLSLNNWYQTAALNESQYTNSLKRKFSVNRVVLPRQTNSMNRIRSTWMKMKLQNTPKTTNNNNKFEMQDLTVTYTI